MSQLSVGRGGGDVKVRAPRDLQGLHTLRWRVTAREWREQDHRPARDLASLCVELVITSGKGVATPRFGRLERPRFRERRGRGNSSHAAV